MGGGSARIVVLLVLFVIVSVIVIVSVSVECRVDRVHIDIYIYRAFFTMVALLGTIKHHVHNIYNIDI